MHWSPGYIQRMARCVCFDGGLCGKSCDKKCLEQLKGSKVLRMGYLGVTGTESRACQHLTLSTHLDTL